MTDRSVFGAHLLKKLTHLALTSKINLYNHHLSTIRMSASVSRHSGGVFSDNSFCSTNFCDLSDKSKYNHFCTDRQMYNDSRELVHFCTN